MNTKHKPLSKKVQAEILRDFKQLEDNGAPALAKKYNVTIGQVNNVLEQYMKKIDAKFMAKFENK